MKQNNQMMHSNSNYKVMARLKHSNKGYTRMIEIDGENFIQFKDITQKNVSSQMTQGFGFNHVFSQEDTQDQVFDKIYEESIQKVFEGHNVAILCYGQSQGGKSYTIFGEHVRTNYRAGMKENEGGLVLRTMQALFKKAREVQEIRQFQFSLSIFEIYLDQVRDLGNQLNQENPQKRKQYLQQNLDVVQNSNGQVIIKNLSSIMVDQMADVYNLLKSAFQLRDEFDTPADNAWDRAHTIVNLNVIQLDKENDNVPLLNSTIQFVDLAGSERIAKSLTDGHKFQDAILINSSLTTLGKCLQQISQQNHKNIPYKNSKLTRCIQNSINASSHITLMANIIPEEKYFQESLASLQFVDRTKCLNQQRKKGDQNLFKPEQQLSEDNPQQNNQEKVVTKLNEEISDIKLKIDIFMKEKKRKFNELKVLLGLDVDIDKMISKPSEKDIRQFKQQRDAIQDIEELDQFTQDLELKISRLKRNKVEMLKDNHVKGEKFIAQILELKEHNKKLREYLQIINNNDNQNNQCINQQINQEDNLFHEVNSHIIHEKLYYQKDIPEIKEKVNHDFKSYNAENYQNNFNQQIQRFSSMKQKLIIDVQQSYEFNLNKLDEKLKNMQEETISLNEKNKNEFHHLKQEMILIYETIRKNAQVVDNIEQGMYSGGKAQLKISAQDKPIAPCRQQYPLLYTFLDQSCSKQVQMKSMKEAEQSVQLQLHLTTQLSHQKFIKKQSVATPHQEADYQGFTKIPFDKERFDFNRDLNEMNSEDLRTYIRQIKQGITQYNDVIKSFNQKINHFEKEYKEVDLENLKKEGEYYKKLYAGEQQKGRNMKVALQSQSRALDKSQRNDRFDSVRLQQYKLTRPQSVQVKTYVSRINNH